MTWCSVFTQSSQSSGSQGQRSVLKLPTTNHNDTQVFNSRSCWNFLEIHRQTNMRAVAIAFLALATAVPQRIHNQEPVLQDGAAVLSQQLIDTVNQAHSTWTAAPNKKFMGMTVGAARSLMGTFLDGPMPEPLEDEVYENIAVPDSFDAREAWPDCPSIPMVRDQSSCGSCWAFGSTESFNDRLCVATKNPVILSPADVLGCCSFTCGFGCNGGYPAVSAFLSFVLLFIL